jgi:DNA recombination protein RmuC
MESQQRFADAQGLRLNDLTTRNEQRIGELRATLDAQLKGLQEGNERKLEQMRQTVDEKRRPRSTRGWIRASSWCPSGWSRCSAGWARCSSWPPAWATSSALSNVKNRGSWGEVQLDAILEQTLTAEQYARG